VEQFFKFPKGMNMKEIIVKEVSDPFEGQQAYAQDGTFCVYSKGEWMSKKEYDRGVYIRLLDTGDCV
jgi:hypothetical protein